DTKKIGHNRRFAEQPRATGGTEPPAQDVATVPLHIEVFHLPSDLHCGRRHEEHGDIRSTGRPLAIAAVTVAGYHGFRGAVIPHGSTQTTARKRCGHNTLPPFSV